MTGVGGADGAVPPPAVGATNLIALEGGVSGAVVWRAEVDRQSVVIKRTDQLEIDVLRQLAALDEPMIPTMIDNGADDHGPWLMIDFHPGPTAGLTGGLPDVVHRCLGRVHAHFVGQPIAADLEPIDEAFVVRAMTDFAPATLTDAGRRISSSLDRRARELIQCLVADDTFRTAAEQFDRTLLHSDLYGLNVLLPTAEHLEPMIIDWNTARLGPAMFDVAMTAGYRSAARRAHDHGWLEVRGDVPDRLLGVTSHAWSQALINATFAGVLAVRHSAEEAERMIMIAEESYHRFRTVVHDHDGLPA